MAIECSCPECAYRCSVADELAGKSILCRECQTRFKVKSFSRTEDDEASVAMPRTKAYTFNAVLTAFCLGAFVVGIVAGCIGFFLGYRSGGNHLPIERPIAATTKQAITNQPEMPSPSPPIPNKPTARPGHNVTEEPQPQPPESAPTFDSTDVDRTFRWLILEGKELFSARATNNALLFKDAENNLRAKFARLSGAEFIWKLRVDRVDELGIWLDFLTEPSCQTFQEYFAASNRSSNGGPPLFVFRVFVPLMAGATYVPKTTAEWNVARRLVKGGRVLMSGKISGIDFGFAGNKLTLTGLLDKGSWQLKL